ncbi:MAG: choice-of-anchor D domain-containing protein [Acidimicrobiales bacterium]
MKTRITHSRVLVAGATALVGLLVAASPSLASTSTTVLPIVVSFTANKQSVPYAGAKVVFTAKLQYGKSCVLSVTPSITGLPKTASCGKSFEVGVAIPATTAESPVNYTFVLTVTNSAGSVSSDPNILVTQGALPPPISFTPTPVKFAKTALTISTAPAILTVHNNSTTTSQTISSWYPAGTDPQDFQTTTTPGGCSIDDELSPGASCNLEVTFKPRGPGPRAATLNFIDASWNPSVGGTIVPATLKGTGTYSLASASQAKVTWPVYGVGVQSKTVTETITNSEPAGGAVLAIASVNSWQFGGDAATDFSVLNNGGTCSNTTIDAQKTCSFTILFTPGGEGTRTATLTLPDNTSFADLSISLSGTGQFGTGSFSNLVCTSDSCTTTPWATSGGTPTYAFGSTQVGAESAITVQIADTSSTVGLELKGGETSGSDPYDFRIGSNGCASNLNVETVGASCTFQIVFGPTTTGLRTAELQIFDNTQAGSWTIDLSGTAPVS